MTKKQISITQTKPGTLPETDTRPWAGIGRVSTEGQIDGYSPAAQRVEVRRVATAKGATIPDKYLFSDDGFQGNDFERPGLQAARQLIRDGMIQGVVFPCIDRMARSVRGGLNLIAAIHADGGTVIVGDRIVKPGEDLDLIFYVELAYAEMEKKRISERVSFARVQCISQKRIPAGRVPYGFKLGHGADEGKWLVCDRTNKTLKMIFGWCRDGKSLREIAIMLNTKKIPTPENERRESRGREWTLKSWGSSSLGVILRNPEYYTGVHIDGKVKVVDNNRHRKLLTKLKNKRTNKVAQPQSGWDHFEIPKLIEETLWRQAQKQLDANAEVAVGRKATTSEPNLLRGLLKCAHCGSPVGSCGSSGKHGARVDCTNRSTSRDRKGARGTCIKNRSVYLRPVVAATLEAMRETFADADALEKKLRADARLLRMQEPTDHAEIRLRLDGIKQRELNARMEQGKLDTRDPDDEAAYAQYARTILALKAEHKMLSRQVNVVTMHAQPNEAVREGWAALLGLLNGTMTNEEMREIIELLVEKVTFGGDEIVIHIRVPRSRLLEKPNKTGGQYCPIRLTQLDNFIPLQVVKKLEAA